MNETNRLISSWGTTNLLMACVVNDKTCLSKDERQKSSIAEFCPWIVKCFYQQEDANEQDQVKKYLSTVVRRLLRQQPALPHESM